MTTLKTILIWTVGILSALVLILGGIAGNIGAGSALAMILDDED